MRSQARAYILAHGGNPDAVAEPDMVDIMVGIQDGLIGNKRVVEVMGSLTAGVFNYLRETGKQPYKLQDIIGPMYDYIYRPETEQEKTEKVQARLMQFMRSAPNAHKHLKIHEPRN